MHALGTLIGGPIADRISLETCFIVGSAFDFVALIFVFFISDKDMHLSASPAMSDEERDLRDALEAGELAELA